MSAMVGRREGEWHVVGEVGEREGRTVGDRGTSGKRRERSGRGGGCRGRERAVREGGGLAGEGFGVGREKMTGLQVKGGFLYLKFVAMHSFFRV